MSGPGPGPDWDLTWTGPGPDLGPGIGPGPELDNSFPKCVLCHSESFKTHLFGGEKRGVSEV